MQQKPKTAPYTKRAVDNYRSKHDFLNITLDKGEKDLLASVGIDNKEIIEIIRAEYKKRVQKTETTISEQPEAQTTPEPQPEEKSFMPKPTQASINFFD